MRNGKSLLLLLLPLYFSRPAPAASSLFSSDEKQAFASSKKTGKPLLIDFYGIWCPPCNQLDETVFNTPVFIQRAKSFTLLKIDADAESSWTLKSRYKVGGYPTVVFADSKGREIYRIVGYREVEEFVRVMDLVLSSKSKNFETACKSKSTEDLWRCATVCWEKKDSKCADAAFAKLAGKIERTSIRYDLAREYAVEYSQNDDLKRIGFEALLQELPASPRALFWALSYLELFDSASSTAAKKELVELVLANYEKAKADPRGGEAGVIGTDLAANRASLLQKLGKTEEGKKAWKQAADLYQTLGDALPKDVSRRGYALEQAYCLEQAGEFDKALALSSEYRAKYPEEFTFNFQNAGMLRRAKRFNDAIALAEKAFKVGYGDNKIRAATLLLQLYATVPNKDAGRQVFEAMALERKPAADMQVRTHRYLKQLDDAWSQLQKS